MAEETEGADFRPPSDGRAASPPKIERSQPHSGASLLGFSMSTKLIGFLVAVICATVVMLSPVPDDADRQTFFALLGTLSGAFFGFQLGQAGMTKIANGKGGGHG